MALKSINPATGEEIASFEEFSEEQVRESLGKAHSGFEKWARMSFDERAVFMKKAAEILRDKAEEFAKVMALEMGKPVVQGKAEAEKCAWACDFYAEKAEEFLKVEVVETDAKESYVQFDPLGVVLAVMPWNYPFWQVFRAAAPILMAGNAMVLKHASNVPQCGFAIESVFKEAGFPEGVFQNLPIGSGKVEMVIRDERVVAATLTGSEYAGSKVAEACGSEIKKTVLELGGSAPFIVLEDADIEKAAEVAVMARFQNCGQSCIASKRFIVVDKVYDRFVEAFKGRVEALKVGDPMDPEVQMGPVYSVKGCEEIKSQFERSVVMGARVVCGGNANGAFFEPTILADVTVEMPAFREETFGPLATVTRVSDFEDALVKANDTVLSLSASVFTEDRELAKKLAGRLNFGAVFVNGIVKSDPRLPFGGVGKSGYGRELSHYGMKEFVNVKTVWVE